MKCAVIIVILRHYHVCHLFANWAARLAHVTQNIIYAIFSSHGSSKRGSTSYITCIYSLAMMTSSNGKKYALLAIYAGKSPVPGEFPVQRPVTRSFDVFFDLRLNKRLSKQWWCWWFVTPSRPLWRHCNGDLVQCDWWRQKHALDNANDAVEPRSSTVNHNTTLHPTYILDLTKKRRHIPHPYGRSCNHGIWL